MLKKQNILTKILIMVVPLALIAVFLGIYTGISELSTLNEAKAIYYDELKDLIDKIVSEDRDFYQAQLASDRAHLLRERGDAQGEADELAEFDENKQQVYDGIDVIAAEFANDPYLYNDYRAEGETQSAAAFISAARDAISKWDAIYDPHTETGNYEEQYPEFLTARGDINELAEIVEAYSVYIDNKMQSEIHHKIIVLVVILVIVVVLIGLLVVSIIRYIIGATSAASEAIEHLANGEFVKADKYLDYEDEIGHMIRDTNGVIDRLQGIIGNVKDMTITLGTSSDDLSSTAGQISQTADDVSNAIQEIAKGATEQADNIQQASESVGDIDNAVSSVTDNTQILADTANEMNESSQASVSELDKLMKSSADMNQNVEEITAAISATSVAVNAINDKVDMITNIASQTNLLALNASIEAARAGDAGRGFAVVATEIGNLATDSNTMADEIRKEMTALLDQSEQANKKAEEVKKVVLEQQEVLQATVDSIHSLISNIETTVGGVGSISSDAGTCITAKDVVVDAMSSLSAISEENAAATQETAASMQELNATVNVLADSAARLNDLAQQLTENISFFK